MGSIGELIETIFSYLFGAGGYVAKQGAKKMRGKYGGFSKPKKSQSFARSAPVEYGTTNGEKKANQGTGKRGPDLRRNGSRSAYQAPKKSNFAQQFAPKVPGMPQAPASGPGAKGGAMSSAGPPRYGAGGGLRRAR